LPPSGTIRPSAAAAPPSSVISSPRGDPPQAVGGVYVQIGTYSKQENAQRMQEKVAAFGTPVLMKLTNSTGATLYRVRVGPYTSRPLAEDLLQRVQAAGMPDARVVVD
jgi:rare lipoprotein A